jgi:hypothetical protein
LKTSAHAFPLPFTAALCQIAAFMLDRWGKTPDLYDTLYQDGNPVPCPERDRFYEWLECYPDRIVVQHDNLSPSRDLFVRTVFCGSDDNFNGPGLPLLWAIVIFGGPHSGNEQRYRSREDALKGHQAALMLALQSPKAKSENERLKCEKVWRHDYYRKFSRGLKALSLNPFFAGRENESLNPAAHASL